jgi:DNA-binding FrmR family transcriptional regulator
MPKGIPRNITVQKRAIHRYKIAKGHLEKVVSMLEKGEYCLDIVHQSIAVQAALRNADQVVLKNHLQTCVAESIRRGNDKEAIEEIMEVLRKK